MNKYKHLLICWRVSKSADVFIGKHNILCLPPPFTNKIMHCLPPPLAPQKIQSFNASSLSTAETFLQVPKAYSFLVVIY